MNNPVYVHIYAAVQVRSFAVGSAIKTKKENADGMENV